MVGVLRPAGDVGGEPEAVPRGPRHVSRAEALPPPRVGVDDGLRAAEERDLGAEDLAPLRDALGGEAPRRPLLGRGPLEVEEDRAAPHLGEGEHAVDAELRLFLGVAAVDIAGGHRPAVLDRVREAVGEDVEPGGERGAHVPLEPRVKARVALLRLQDAEAERRIELVEGEPGLH